MKVTLVTRDSIYGRFVADALVQAGAVDRVLVELQRAPAAFFLRKFRRVGLPNFFFQWWLNRWFEAEGKQYLPASELPPHERIRSINDVQTATHELFIGFGSSIVTAATLSRLPHGMLNLHTGILPRYRGVKSEFWALHHGDRDGIGWTLHYMTPRLDDGGIVRREVVPVTGKNPAGARAQVLIAAVASIAELLNSAKRLGSPPIAETPTDEAGRYYTSPTWAEWRRFRGSWKQSPEGLSAK